MYRYQTKHKVLSLLLVLTLLILTSVSVFPSPVLAQDEVWDCPDIPIILDLFEPAPQYCSGPLMPPLPEVKKLILGVVRPPPVPELTLLVDLWPEMTMERGVSLEWVMNNSWSSTTHAITVVPGPEYDIIEVTFEPPIPVVDQVCLSYFQDIPASRVDVVLLQLLYSPPEDFGDAPDPTYPTLLNSNGARHQITGLFLGAVVDGEPDGQPDATATGDDLNNDDEDGVTFTTPLIPGNMANLSVVASAPGLLNAWVDFNINGVWSDAGEQIFTDLPLVPGVNNLSFGVPAGAATGATFSRFRLSSLRLLSFDGAAPDGEVEDYQVQIIEPEPGRIDFGDAPDPTYPTLLASTGASHQITGLFLGAVVDSEPDGQPTATADGDDINNDDEDGVTFTTPLIPGNMAGVDVVASAPGLLDAWVDFNINGVWSDAGEQIFTNQPLTPGLNNLSFGVPAGAATGATFSRFRVSNNGRLSFDGAAPDGEVEDYQVRLSEREPVTEVGGEVYPVDRLAILIPGLTLAAILIVGVAVVMRRRRARC